ncbi:MAG: hypothetical protein GMKNLPBB_00609 [Myxococcota bacterium]|nr:hypothetical protein [Myxococcota bacterium]
MAAITEYVNLKVSTAADAYARLSQREQQLVAGMSALLAAMFLAIVTYLVSSSISEKESRVNSKLDSIERIARVRSVFLSNRAATDQMKQRVQQIESDPNFNVFSFIEKQAASLNISVANMQERQTTVDRTAEVVEKTTEVFLREIPYDKLLDFLHRIENSPYMLYVSRLKLNVREDGDKRLLDAQFLLSGFRLNPNYQPGPRAAGKASP